MALAGSSQCERVQVLRGQVEGEFGVSGRVYGRGRWVGGGGLSVCGRALVLVAGAGLAFGRCCCYWFTGSPGGRSGTRVWHALSVQ